MEHYLQNNIYPSNVLNNVSNQCSLTRKHIGQDNEKNEERRKFLTAAIRNITYYIILL